MRKLLLWLFWVFSLPGVSQTFTLPEIPDNLCNDREMKEYVVIHYWDNYNFIDPSVFVDGDGVLDYFRLLYDVPYSVSDESIFRTLGKASENNQIFSLFIDAYRVYLMNPESYFCDYERYQAVVEFVMANERIPQSKKRDFLYEESIIFTNRVGEKANNFKVSDKNNNRLELWNIESEYLIVFFHNPRCGICLETKEKLSNSLIINEMISSGRLTVFSVCPYDEYDSWTATEYPNLWLNGFDIDGEINGNQWYYFLNSSSLYLLDKDKRVLKKDVRFDLLENYLIEIETMAQ